MLQPKRNIRKRLKGRNTGLALRGNKVSFGSFGLKCVAHGQITARQIESARRAISREIKRGGKIFIRLFPDVPRTKKPLEVRQGSGKGSIDCWVALVQPGRVMFELEGIPEDIARRAFQLAAAKLPVKTMFVTQTEM